MGNICQTKAITLLRIAECRIQKNGKQILRTTHIVMLRRERVPCRLIFNASQNGHFHGTIWELIPEDSNKGCLSNQMSPWIFYHLNHASFTLSPTLFHPQKHVMPFLLHKLRNWCPKLVLAFQK